MKGAPCTVCIFWHMSFVLTQCVVTFSGYVCVREAGLLPRPYHANPFCRISGRQASVTNCSLLDMFLIRLHRHGTWGVDDFQCHSSLSVMMTAPSSQCEHHFSSAIHNKDQIAAYNSSLWVNKLIPSQSVRGILSFPLNFKGCLWETIQRLWCKRHPLKRIILLHTYHKTLFCPRSLKNSLRTASALTPRW